MLKSNAVETAIYTAANLNKSVVVYRHQDSEDAPIGYGLHPEKNSVMIMIVSPNGTITET